MNLADIELQQVDLGGQQRSDRVFIAIQSALSGAALEDIAAELSMTTVELVAELEAELADRGATTENLGVLDPAAVAEAVAEIRGLHETPDRDG